MRRRLLLVEDDPTLRQALTFNLAREGYEVATAADGEAALEAGRVHRYRRTTVTSQRRPPHVPRST